MNQANSGNLNSSKQADKKDKCAASGPHKPIHPFYAAYSAYLQAKANVHNPAVEADEVMNIVCDKLDEARTELMLTPVPITMDWAIMIKFGILEEELSTDAISGAKTYAEHLVWLAAIKADFAKDIHWCKLGKDTTA